MSTCTQMDNYPVIVELAKALGCEYWQAEAMYEARNKPGIVADAPDEEKE